MKATKQTAPRAADAAAAGLTKALLQASQRLAVQQKDLAPVIGVSAASLSRLSRGREIDPDTKEGELAILFVRLYRSLDALLGGDEAACREWLHASNAHLGGVPSDLIRTAPGLVHVVEYLDAMRGSCGHGFASRRAQASK